MVSTLQGNWLVLAGPFALWSTVVSFPKFQNRMPRGSSLRSRRRKKSIEVRGSVFSWRLYLALAIWAATAILLWPRINRASISDAEIVAAINRATTLFQEGRYEEALAGFWVIEIPQCFAIRRAQKYHNIGLIQFKLGRPTEAEGALEQAVKYDPKDLDAYYLLVRIALSAGDYSKASRYLEAAQSQLPDSANLPQQFSLLKAELERSGNVP